MKLTYGEAMSEAQRPKGVLRGIWAVLAGLIFIFVTSLGTDAVLHTTGGQGDVSAASGERWSAIVHDLPPVLSVGVQTLP